MHLFLFMCGCSVMEILLSPFLLIIIQVHLFLCYFISHPYFVFLIILISYLLFIIFVYFLIHLFYLLVNSYELVDNVSFSHFNDSGIVSCL